MFGTMFATFAKIGALVLFLDITLRETTGPDKEGARLILVVLFLVTAYLILRSATRPRARRRAR